MNKGLFGLELMKNRLLNKRVPMYVSYLVNHSCNMRCAYCYGVFYEQENEVLSTEQALAMLDELSQLGTRRLCLIGGEPLIRKDIKEIVLHARTKNMECVLNTNGLLVEKNIEWLHHLNHLYISFDGDKKGHELNRGINTFEQVLDAIKLASFHKIPLGIVTVLTKNNLDAIDYLIDLSKQHNFGLNFFNMIAQNKQTGREMNQLIPSNAEYRKAFTKIKSAKMRGANITYSLKAIDITLQWPDYQKETIVGQEPVFDHCRCYAGVYYCVIDSNGDMFPCPMLMTRSKHTPNVVREGVQGAWRKTINTECKACCFSCYVDLNLFFGLNLDTVAQHVKAKLKEALGSGRGRQTHE